MSVTSVQISRETSEMLGEAAKASGLRKGYLADTAIRFFLDPEKNPEIAEALKSVNHLRENALEQAFAERMGRVNDGRH
jgi:predicted transcriptional regulator